MNHTLNLHQTCKTKQHHVQLDYIIKDNRLIGLFKIIKNMSPFLFNENFSTKHLRNWGLWEFDVVEIFLQPRNTQYEIMAEYLEVQISPLNQQFALCIRSPRKNYYTPLNFHFNSHSEIKHNVWTCDFEIILPAKRRIYANFTACLGDKNSREYWQLHGHKTLKPDFHHPELFELLKIQHLN